MFKITQPANLKILLIASGAGLALYFYLRRLSMGEAEANQTRQPWYRTALWLGLVLTLIGPIPAWVTGQSVSQDNPLGSGRLGKASMIGASLVANLNAFNKLPKEYQQILQEEVIKMVKYTYDVSGPALEKIAQEEGKKQFGAEAVFISDGEFVKFREAVKPLWDEWEKKSDYCAQLVKIAREFAYK